MILHRPTAAAVAPPHSRRAAVALTGLLLVSLCLARASGAEDAQTGGRRRGQYLRTEVVRTEAQKTYSCTLAPTAASYPVLIFRRQERLRLQEVRIYEVVTEERTTDIESGREGIRYRVSPGDEMRGENTTRETNQDLGAFADEPFLVMDIAVRSDAAGLYVDRQQRLLVPFDDLSNNTVDLKVQHRELGPVTLRLSRYLTLRWNDKRPEERLRLVQTDLLVALGADFEPQALTGRDGLQIEIEVPASVQSGQSAVVRVRARNHGKRAVSCLTGRLFGRHPWLSGLNLYLGNVPPGGMREFERVIQAPAGSPAGAVFATLGFWDLLGPLPDLQRPISVRILPPANPTGATPQP